MKLSNLLNIIASTLVVTGMTVLLMGVFARRNNASLISQPIYISENQKQPEISEPNAIQGKPIELAIEDLNIRSGVIDGVFDANNGKWTLTTKNVQFALISVQPNNKSGMTFMYGHNRKEVFSKLPKIKLGTTATIKTDNGLLFTYRYTGSQVVKPENASIFEYKGPPILVLQTCTGMFYQNRQQFNFEFIEVKDA